MRNHCSRLEGHTIIKFKDNVCSLFQDGKCSAYKVRPIQCRAFPFWEESLDDWVWHEEIATICPGVNRGRLYSAREIEKIASQVEKALETELEEVES